MKRYLLALTIVSITTVAVVYTFSWVVKYFELKDAGMAVVIVGFMVAWFLQTKYITKWFAPKEKINDGI